jgi:Saxitoxin biosynthesis operon protein SxtJ
MASAIEPKMERGPAPEGSDRGFGVVFAVVFLLIALWPLIHSSTPRWWALGIAAAFAIIAFVRPQLLHPMNRVWLAFGRLLHRLVSPLIMGAIFFLCVTPTGWIMRVLRKDVLSLKRQPERSSYWILREPAPSAPESMKNQF